MNVAERPITAFVGKRIAVAAVAGPGRRHVAPGTRIGHYLRNLTLLFSLGILPWISVSIGSGTSEMIM